MSKVERFAGSFTEGATYVKRGKVKKAEGDLVQYFGQVDMDNAIYAIYRKRYTDDLIYQEQWNQSTSSWNFTTRLMGLITGGDCTLTEIQEADAMKAFPVAFPA